jgi:3-oxoacyl-[acyl-carrier-protein] synthase-3
VLFGDGAGAAILEPSAEPGVIDSVLAMDGRHAGLLTVPAGATETPATPETVAAGLHAIHMPDGGALFRQAVLAMASACSELLAKAGLDVDDVDLVVPHQANGRIIAAVAKRLGIVDNRIVVDVEDVGNTSAASIPIALDRAAQAGRLSPGDTVLTVAFGAGLAWGANLIRWTAERPAPEPRA